MSSIAQAHGGSVEYRPRSGGGSVFSITLPLSKALRDAEAEFDDDVEGDVEGDVESDARTGVVTDSGEGLAAVRA